MTPCLIWGNLPASLQNDTPRAPAGSLCGGGQGLQIVSNPSAFPQLAAPPRPCVSHLHLQVLQVTKLRGGQGTVPVGASGLSTGGCQAGGPHYLLCCWQ